MQVTDDMLKFSHYDIMLISLIDAIQFAGLFLTGSSVPPAMTIILLHTSTPCIVYCTSYFFPDRKYSTIHFLGVNMINISLLLCLIQPIVAMVSNHDHHNLGRLLSSLLYTICAGVQGISILMKERVLSHWAQPLDIHYLSFWLYYYECLILLVLSPLLYVMQGKSISFIFFRLFDSVERN
jgi:hypothetical protein